MMVSFLSLIQNQILIFEMITVSSYGDSSTQQFDGSYRFTAIGQELQINVCGDDTDAYYMSINIVKDLTINSFVFGVFRDLNGPQSVEYNGYEYELNFDGFQLELPGGLDIDKYSYKLRQNQSTNQYILIRYDCDKYNKLKTSTQEIFTLTKISNIAKQECFAPKARFDKDIVFPAMYKSVNLKDTGICVDNEVGCFELESIQDDILTNSCFAWEEVQTGDRSVFGPFFPISLEWDGKLSIEQWVDESSGGLSVFRCTVGTQFVILVDPITIVITWRCSEGNRGATYRLIQINTNSDDFEPCPLAISDKTLSVSTTTTATGEMDECVINGKCDQTEDCCNGYVNPRDFGITCSHLYKGSMYWINRNRDTNDKACCIKVGYLCSNDNECCKRAMCCGGVCNNKCN
eukprot:364127_1